MLYNMWAQLGEVSKRKKKKKTIFDSWARPLSYGVLEAINKMIFFILLINKNKSINQIVKEGEDSC